MFHTLFRGLLLVLGFILFQHTLAICYTEDDNLLYSSKIIIEKLMQDSKTVPDLQIRLVRNENRGLVENHNNINYGGKNKPNPPDPERVWTKLVPEPAPLPSRSKRRMEDKFKGSTFIPLLWIVATVMAEPPVGDGYPAARGNDHDHGHHDSHDHGDFQRSLSQEYGAPGFGARSAPELPVPSAAALSRSYGIPGVRNTPGYDAASSRSGLSQEYGAPAARNSLSQEYGPPSARSTPSEEYGVPDLRNSISQEYGVPETRGLSQEYGAPNARISDTYGPPSARSLSDSYGPPNARSSFDSYSAPLRSAPATSYGAPDFRSSPSEEYGAPRSGYASARTPSSSYGAPSFGFRSAPSQQYGAPSTRNSGFSGKSFGRGHGSARSFGVSQSYGAPASRSLSTSYGAPSARNSIDSYSQDVKSFGSSYSAPSQRSLSDTYGAPNARSLSQEYGVPSGRAAGLKTAAFASSFGASRSAPSSKYGPPSARSMSHGGDQLDSLSGQGYNYARGSLDELDQEPANYDFAYKVNDYQSGSDFGHTETRQDNRAEGSYFVVLPDGTKQVVEYEADERGFKPRISVEPAGGRSGYDDNAQDLARTGGGPY